MLVWTRVEIWKMYVDTQDHQENLSGDSKARWWSFCSPRRSPRWSQMMITQTTNPQEITRPEEAPRGPRRSPLERRCLQSLEL